jgi:glycolate oxidase FAD binding subunit
VGEATALRLDALSGITEYTPGDLTLTARAATTLAEIEAVTRADGQWLTLSPWGGDAGSLGATAATASAGPVSGALGMPRDVIIGLQVVTGTGDPVRGGGRVVKNVAGFDLTRLMIGAWGTLGVITEVSVRLRALPEHDATVAVPVPPAGAARTEFLTRLRAASIAPLALELVDSGESWSAAERAAATIPGAYAHASVLRSVARVVLPSNDALTEAAFATVGHPNAKADGGLTRVFERLPPALWTATAPSPADDRLSRRIRDAFDPARILNPGVLGEGRS